MWGNIVHLTLAAGLAIEVVAQRTTISVGADDEDDSFSSVPTSTSTSEDPGTCGYVDGDPDDAVTCPSSCALLFVSGRDSLYYGCCNDEQCNIPITCIESGTASGRATLACTEGPSSRCKTWTWPDRSAESYGCATTRTKLTVATEATSITTTGDGDITVSAAPTSGDGDDNDDDSGSPGIGWEHDLDSRQRVGAGIGSGVTGGLLLIFFG
ncbi:hypothetical protein CEP51_007798 [Fusarium floridanum]|uniref:Extracellular membrane protein CFEM domain-containing protein n=1 Tax=Fusarium floridanum TaxID=1325733 RepID=A0A428RMZ5_9HYPO|nr:hypothetical protein CEP51_007798 [Fusarium floridanum]